MARHRRAGHRSSRSSRALIESLEARMMLAHYVWVGGPGTWNDPAHWTTTDGTTPLPGGSDSAFIPESAGEVTIFESGIGSAVIDSDIRIMPAGHFAIAGSGLTLNGTATILGGGPFATRFGFYNSTATLNGSGTVLYSGGGVLPSGFGTTGSLTIGSGITIRNGTTAGDLNGGTIDSSATIITEGMFLRIGGSKFTNRGTIHINGGQLSIGGNTWTNLGHININGGTLNIGGGTYRQSDFGSYTRSGGTIRLGGTLLGNLTLDEHSGSWEGSGLILRDGRYTASGGASLTGGFLFDNYVLGSNLTVNGVTMNARNDLTLEGTTLRLNAGANLQLTLNTLNIMGTGQIELNGSNLSIVGSSAQAITIGSGITTRVESGLVQIQGNTANHRIAFNGPVIVSTGVQAVTVFVANVELRGELTIASGANLAMFPGFGGPSAFSILDGGSIVTSARSTLTLSRSLNIASTNPGRTRALGTINMGGGSPASPALLEVAGADRGPVPDGFRDNFSIGVLSLSNFVRLVDNHDSSPGAQPEALYVDSLHVPTGATLDLNGLNVYARATQVVGSILNGTVALIPDGGPIAWAVPTSGRISAVGQQDEWTFFGRKGQAISAVLNPTQSPTPSSPAALAPQLTLGRLTLLSPTGAELVSGQTMGGAPFVTLPNTALPADGTYTLRVQASLVDPNRTGIYNLALYNVSVETRPLVLNRLTTGAIETPFASDRWTFSLLAGQQIQFDLVNSQTTGLQFTLQGPDGYVAFSNLTNDSTLITIPPGRTGNYVLTVRGQTDQTGAYSFLVRDGSVTNLSLGVPFAGALPGSGSPRWFKLTLPSPGQLLVRMDDLTNADRNLLYLRRGALPTREVFDHRNPSYNADPQVYVPNATAGDWYILLYGDHVPAASNYTLTAEFSDLRITALTPDRYGVGNTVTMTITGGGFEPGTVARLVGGATTINASTVEIDSFTQITATFNLAGAPQRTWDVVVERGPLSFTRPASFRTLPNIPAKLETKLHMPSFATRISVRPGAIQYANTGNVAMPAPLIIVQSGDPEGDQLPILSLDMDRTIETFWSATLPPGTSHRLMLLGSGAVPGVLNPGESMTVPFNYLGDLTPFETTDLTLELEMLCVHEGSHSHARNHDSIQWDQLKGDLKPPSVPQAVWDAVYSNLTAPLTTAEAYAAMLVDNAQYLGRLGVRVIDIDELWNFEVQQALGTITAFPTLASAVDAQLPAPGEPLSFTRRFADGVISRNVEGPFGFGWSVPWFATLSKSANDDIIRINGSNGGQRTFVRDKRGLATSYFSSVGDSSSLRRVSANIYELRDLGGVVTRFRADGRIDYVQDANGNRTTAGYDGGRLVSLTHSSGGVINIAYNAAGRISQLTDSLGRTVTYTYDAANDHLLSVAGADGTTINYTYDTSSSNVMRRHALLSETFGGSSQLFTYDTQGRIASSLVTGGAQPVTLTYDLGRISMTDAAGTGQLFFDHHLRLAKVTNALGHSSRMIYDQRGFVSTVILPDGSQQKYTWCDCGSLMSATDELGNTVKFGRDPVTRKVTSITDPKGNVSRMTYDSFGNHLALIHADGSSEFAANHTASGLPQSFTSRGGKVATYVYNAAGQITRRTAPDGTITDYAYDSRGRLTTVTQGTQIITRTYDTAIDGDRLKRITYPGGKFIEYDYDDFGRTIAERDQSGFTTRYEYDAAGRLFQVRDSASAVLASYSYDTAGRLSRIDNGNNTFTTYGYDAADNVLSIENWRSPGVINSRFIYTYDARGRRVTAATLDGNWTYGYDAAGQLTSATFVSTNPQIDNQNIQITYDAAGNRTFATINGVLHDYATNALNQYTRVDGVDYTYDANGNLRSDGVRQFTYDDFNRLIQVQAGADIQQFEYNAMGSRSATIINGVRTDFLVAPDVGGTVMAEYDAAGALLGRNIYIGTLLGRTSGGSVNFFDFDIVGSTAGVTDATGAYINRYAYDPFGAALFTTESFANPYRFIGQFGARGEVGGISQMGLRDYSVQEGRFTTIDPLRFSADVNTYRYANNSPVMNVDPHGLIWASVLPSLSKGVSVGKGVRLYSLETNIIGNLTYSVGVDSWQSLAVSAQTGKLPSTQEAGWAALSSFALNAGFSAPGLNGFAGAFQVAMDPEVNQHFVSAACGLAYQRQFGTINKGAAKQMAMLEAETGGAGPSTVNAACLDGFPQSGDANMGIGDPCGYGETGLGPWPIDPNDKIPPKGFGPDNRVAIENPIEYTIDFENLGPGSKDENNEPYPVFAVVPAQRVAIDDPLSPDLDWSSVVFTEFAFGDTIVSVTDGFGSFNASVPVVANGIAYAVEIYAGVDLETGVLSVIFQAVDPVTGLPPNPLLGVVAPEDGSGNGMGHFTFLVKPLLTVADNTPIRNIAVIRFDANDVIPTNQVDPLDPSKGTDPAREALVTIDVLPPSVIAGPSFDVDAPLPRITVQFSEDVSPGLTPQSIVIENLTTPGTVTPVSVSFDAVTNTASFDLSPALPDGNYRVTLAGANVTDGVGRLMVEDVQASFYFLRGDANRDRKVDVADLGILASNWQQSGRTFSQADFNYDGVVDVADLGILASAWQKELAAPAPAFAPPVKSPRTTPTRVATLVL